MGRPDTRAERAANDPIVAVQIMAPPAACPGTAGASFGGAGPARRRGGKRRASARVLNCCLSGCLPYLRSTRRPFDWGGGGGVCLQCPSHSKPSPPSPPYWRRGQGGMVHPCWACHLRRPPPYTGSASDASCLNSKNVGPKTRYALSLYLSIYLSLFAL